MGVTRLSTENFQLLLVLLTANGCGLLGLQQQIQKGPLLKSFQTGSLMVSFTACFKVTCVPTFPATTVWFQLRSLGQSVQFCWGKLGYNFVKQNGLFPFMFLFLVIGLTATFGLTVAYFKVWQKRGSPKSPIDFLGKRKHNGALSFFVSAKSDKRSSC